MSPEEYMKNRLNDQINWYSNKSKKAQKNYKRLQTIEIFAAALILLLSGFTALSSFVPFLIALLGAVIVICSSISRLGKFHENWLRYRETCELLKHEKYLFMTSSKPYEEQPFQLLVERAESIISAENINWSQLAALDRDKN